ncbi:MAG: copper ion binding protein [Spirochaetaceae bacterium]|jgi:copper chaperone|nr:copper ion binding protein [Spirochaetaceae bacterium]
MAKTVLNVRGMSCEHCVRAVKTALTALPGVEGASVDLKTGKVEVTHDGAKSPEASLKSAIEDAGYEVVA